MAEKDQRDLLEQALVELRRAKARVRELESARREPIGVLGAGVRMPGGVDGMDALWRLLRTGADATSRRAPQTDGRRHEAEDAGAGGWLSDVDLFDADFFGISRDEATKMDPQQRLVLETAWEAIEDAELPVEQVQRSSTGVFLGIYSNDYMSLQMADPDAVNAWTAPGVSHSVAANRLSYLLNLRGPSLAVDTACSSSLVALHLACRALRDGDCDLALVGGVNLILSPLSTTVTGKVLPMAPGQRCRAFDAEADGIIRAEGAGMLLLGRSGEAQARGRRVRGVVRGSAINHDGRTNGLTAPNPRAQVDLIRRALADAGAAPEDVSYVEAHGTGTPLGDPIETDALAEVYGAGESPCGLGSVKTNFGHQEAAAGIAGLAKALLVLEHGEIPPHLHLRRLNPEIKIEHTRLRIVPEGRQLLANGDANPLAAVSSFGFGGANAHVVLEKPPGPPAGPAPDRPFLLPLSARSAGSLTELRRRYADLLDGREAGAAADVCAAAAVGRTHQPHRIAVSARRPAELVRELRNAPVPAAPAPRDEERTAFVFGGQGSHWIGMGRELLATESTAHEEFEACDAVTRDVAGLSIIEELECGADRSRLDRTEVSQLAIGGLQLALAALWHSWGVRPYAMLGHSMGEVIAACAAGMLDREQTFDLLLRRARIAERGAGGGSMVNVRLPPDEVETLLAGTAGRLDIAATNAPSSTVVSGSAEAVSEFARFAEQQGVRVRTLPVDYGFHSSLLDGCDAELAEDVGDVRAGPGSVPLYSTVTGGVVDHARLDGWHWGRNLRSVVRFDAAVRGLLDAGVTTFVEIDPHPVLMRDINEILEESTPDCSAVGSLHREHDLPSSLYESLAELYRCGHDIRWDAVLPPPSPPVSVPTYPWRRRRYWLESADRPAEPAADSASGPVATMDVESIARYLRERIAAALELDDADVSDGTELESIGLNSLTVVELRNKVGRELGIRVPLRALLEGGTIRDLAEVIHQAPESE